MKKNSEIPKLQQANHIVWAAFITVLATLLFAGAVAVMLYFQFIILGVNAAWNIAIFAVFVGCLSLFVPWAKARKAQNMATTALQLNDIVKFRVETAEARESSWIAIGWSSFAFIALAFIGFIFMNNAAVGRTFFYLPLMEAKFWLVTGQFFKFNVTIFIFAEILVLIWGLIVALARLAPGRAGLPLRVLAITYCDLFRGLPSIVTLYLIGFGIPTSGLPDLVIPHVYAYFVDTSAMSALEIKSATRIPVWAWCVLALTLTYGAYVAEVYRAGIESIHASQVSAARSLGLSYMQTMRYVIVPQAIRRIVAPLLNEFITLQKDTALVSVVGVIDGFNQAKIIAANAFNLSAVTVVAILFVLITIPQARLVDHMMERDALRRRSGG